MSLRRALLLMVLAALTRGQDPARRPGVAELARTPLPPRARPGTTHPVPPVYVLRPDGRPLLSEAGFLQLADEGPGFYYGALNPDRLEHARRIGMIGTNNWGDVEAMCLAGRVVGRWRESHPGVRLGLDEISARWAGFPDYDRDGVSDHLTHQAGMNINFLVPCPVRPERYIHLGVARDELFDHRLFLDLLDILVDEGAFRMTTNRDAFAPAGDPAASGSRHGWKETDRRADGYSVTLAIPDRPVRLYLLTPKGDHGDHVNALMWRSE